MWFRNALLINNNKNTSIQLFLPKINFSINRRYFQNNYKYNPVFKHLKN